MRETELLTKRDRLIRELWLTMKELSYLQGCKDFTDEDLNVWTAVTGHSAIQDKLDGVKP